MIKLNSRHCLVSAGDGTVRTLDLEAVRSDLLQSFRVCGIDAAWVADHIALVIEEHLASSADPAAEPLPERDLQAMVGTMLAACGYDDVARAYRQGLPEGLETAAADPFRPWDQARIEADLAHVLPLDLEERRALAAITAKALTAMGLLHVRSALIGELGCHVMQRAMVVDSTSAPDSLWLLAPTHWPLDTVPGAERLVADGVLGLLPVSRLLPRVRLEVDLRRLAATVGTLPLPELVYLPALARVAGCVAALIRAARQALPAGPPRARSPAAHVVVRGLDEVLHDALLPQSARAAKALRQEVRAVLESRLPGAAGEPVLLTFR